MRVIIAGSRTITDPKVIEEAVAASGFVITEVVCGGANGADTLGKDWAVLRGIPVKMFPADWDTYGKAAGPIRNAQMAEYADQAICIFDVQAECRGTKNMVGLMHGRGKPVFSHMTNFKSIILE
jgi:hypothetical protein